MAAQGAATGQAAADAAQAAANVSPPADGLFATDAESAVAAPAPAEQPTVESPAVPAPPAEQPTVESPAVPAAQAPPPPDGAAPEPEPAVDDDELEPPHAFEVPPAPVPSGEAPHGISRPPSADAAEERLVAAGLSRALAADVVGEAVVHALPFSAPRNMKRLVRSALARRIPTPTALGTKPRTLAIVGGGGAGKSTAIAHLAAVYAAAGAEVAVIDLRGDHGLAGRLQPLGIGVIAAADAVQAKERLERRQPLMTLIDTPATGPSTPAAEVKALAGDLRALGAEVHLALPATLSAAAAGELAAALAPLAPTHVALTHSDETSRPGAPLELALAAGRPLSYVCSRDGATPADAASLAAQLLP